MTTAVTTDRDTLWNNAVATVDRLCKLVKKHGIRHEDWPDGMCGRYPNQGVVYVAPNGSINAAPSDGNVGLGGNCINIARLYDRNRATNPQWLSSRDEFDRWYDSAIAEVTV
jgi:hypothetical protein